MGNDKKQPTNKTTALSVKKEQAISNQLATTSFEDFLEYLVKSPNTGVKDKGEAMLMLSKARELGIGFGNAVPHMHVINGKPGIDIHIIKAILSKPSSGVTWKLIKEYEPVYQLLTRDKAVIKSNEVPKDLELVLVPLDTLMKTDIEKGEFIASVIVKDKKPFIVDYETEYLFTRKYKDIDGEFKTRTAKGYFSWSMACDAQLPYNRAGDIDPNSAWSKYRSLMIGTRAFTYGAREIASDLLMGNYETSELFDINNVPYDIEVEDAEAVVVEKEKEHE